MRAFIFIFLLVQSLTVLAQISGPVINIDDFVETKVNTNKADSLLNEYSLNYLHIIPRFEENPNPNKVAMIEVYQGFYDKSQESKTSIKFIRELIDNDKRINPSMDFVVSATTKDGLPSLKHNSDFKNLIKEVNYNKPVKHQTIPNELKFAPNTRTPDAVNVRKIKFKVDTSKIMFTALRFSLAGGVTGWALYSFQHVPLALATSIAIFPGIGSAAITYFYDSYANWLTNEKWSKFFLESDKPFMVKLRRKLNINGKTLGDFVLSTHKTYSKNKYFKDLMINNPEDFNSIVRQDAQKLFNRSINPKRTAAIIKKFGMLEEYLKWYLSEVAFISLFIEAPNIVAGLGHFDGILPFTAKMFAEGTKGFAAQGLGDIAIGNKRKQDLEKLYDAVKKNDPKYSKIRDRAQLLDELDKIFDPEIKYKVGPSSHKLLRRIENLAKFRAASLSFFSVGAVVLSTTGSTLAIPALLTVGASGALYYANVKGWLTLKSTLNFFKKTAPQAFKQILSGNFSMLLQPIYRTICLSKFISPKYSGY